MFIIRLAAMFSLLMLLPSQALVAMADTPVPATRSASIIGLTSPNTLTIAAGKSAVLTFPDIYRKCALGNSEVADCSPLSPTQILVTAKHPGVTNIIIVLGEQSPLPPIDVIVTPAMQPVEAIAVHAESNVAPPAVSRWFSSRSFWLATAVLPLVCLIACLEPLIRRGKGRVIVTCWIWIWFAIGQICFSWGIAAVGHGERIKDVGPMLLASVTVWIAMLFASRRMSRRYRDVELRKMQLMDAV